MKKYLPFALCIAIASWYGCTKDDTIQVKNYEQLLVDKKWQLTAITTGSANGVSVNKFDSLPAYSKDDYFLFKADSTFELNDNIDTMPGSKHSRILDEGTWELTSSGDLDMHSDVFNSDYTRAKILELDSKVLRLERRHPGDGSVTTTSYKSF